MDKLSSYNIFNYLFPGTLFITLAEQLTSFRFLMDSNWVYQLFLFYIAGMILSRIGSLLIEWIYKKLCIVIYSSYPNYLEANQKDKEKKISILLQENNIYRTLVATFISLLILLIINQFKGAFEFCTSPAGNMIEVLVLIILFSMAYSKQTMFIRKRVHHLMQKDDKEEKVKQAEADGYKWASRLVRKCVET